jgi:hypothetical protein
MKKNHNEKKIIIKKSKYIFYFNSIFINNFLKKVFTLLLKNSNFTR